MIILFHVIVSKGQKQLKCILNHDNFVGSITTCELYNVSYNITCDSLQLENSSISQDLANKAIRVKFISKLNGKNYSITDYPIQLKLCFFVESEVHLIPTSIFEQLSRIEILEIDRVGLRNILQDSFESANFLKVLNASGNEIQMLGPFTFHEAESLEILDLSSNIIKFIDHKTFVGLTNLESLSLSNNKISIIDEKTFEPLKSLKWIWLDRNEIQIVPLNNIVLNQNMIGIYLNMNKISAIFPDMFDHISAHSNLKFIYLAGNKCTNQNFIAHDQNTMKDFNFAKELVKCFNAYRIMLKTNFISSNYHHHGTTEIKFKK